MKGVLPKWGDIIVIYFESALKVEECQNLICNKFRSIDSFRDGRRLFIRKECPFEKERCRRDLFVIKETPSEKAL